MLVSGVVSAVDVAPGHAEVRLEGELRLGTVGDLHRALAKLLASHQWLLVDLTRVRLARESCVQVFAAALAATDGWPSTGIVLFGADPAMAAALHRLRVTRTVPLAPDRAAARHRLGVRPATVRRRVRLPPSTAAPGTARRFVERAWREWALPGSDLAARQVVNELVTNAVQHARTDCELEVRLDVRGLWIEVRDFRVGAAPRPRPRLVGGSEGRGLHVVAGLSSHSGSTEHRDGKSIWALLPVTGAQ